MELRKHLRCSAQVAGSSLRSSGVSCGLLMQEPEEMATAALWLYGVAFDELKRQVYFAARCMRRQCHAFAVPPRPHLHMSVPPVDVGSSHVHPAEAQSNI